MLKIPLDSLSPDTLEAIVQEFITREGTDYGLEELALEEKCRRLIVKIKADEVYIVFDDATESVTMMTAEAYQHELGLYESGLGESGQE